MTGNTGYTAPTNGDAPDFGGDMAAIYAHFDPLIGPSVANVAALPGSGNWDGRLIYVKDVDLLYVYDSGWSPATNRGRFQTDTTSAAVTALVKTQAGVGKITGSAATSLNESVTFPETFNAAPAVVVSYRGSRATGAYNDSSLTPSGIVWGTGAAPSTSGFTAYIAQGSNFSAVNDYYYSWIAVGLA